ncbi:hypothetical protein [Pseudomonas corrugata]|uniref:hypothetical protein n=1 Tax=Pseudomonas corrugata TaxID=47879 RepID=UPI0006D8A8C2|nr:hypothetical protein [Pseudomonas corrugata]
MKHHWLESDLADLGKITDEALAARIGVSMPTVRRERLRRGIAASKPHPTIVPWTPEDLALLGTITDESLGRLTGRATTAVQQKRLSLGISPVRKKPPVNWTNEDMAEFGRIPDSKIAKRKGVSTSVVFEKRQSLGIEACPMDLRDSRSTWRESDVALFGTMSDVQVGKRIKRPTKSVTQERLRLGIAAYAVPKTSMDLVPARSRLTVAWRALKDLEQKKFFEILAHEYQERTGRKLTLEKLSKLTYVDLKSLQKWFKSVDCFFPLPLTTRHHLWLALAFSI